MFNSLKRTVARVFTPAVVFGLALVAGELGTMISRPDLAGLAAIAVVANVLQMLFVVAGGRDAEPARDDPYE